MSDKFKVCYRKFTGPNTQTWTDHTAEFNTAEEMLSFYDRTDWGSWLYYLHYVSHNGEYIKRHECARYSHEKSIDIDTIDSYRKQEVASA